MSLLEASRNLSVTRDADKVYGLLGLTCDALGEILEVDLTRSAVEVYIIEGAKFDIANDPTLTVLRFASSNQPLEGRPSWCPTFSGPRATALLGAEALNHHTANYVGINFFPFVSPSQVIASLPSLWPDAAGLENRSPFQSLNGEGSPIHHAGLDPSLLYSAPGILQTFNKLVHTTTCTTNNLLNVNGVKRYQDAQVVPDGWQWDNSANFRLTDGRADRTLVWEDARL